MMTRVTTLTVCMILLFCPLTFAHGGATHVMGTVTALDTQHVVVQTKDGKTISVLLKKETKYRKGEAAAIDADLKVGDRVVVEGVREGDVLTASEIRFASPGEKKEHEGMPHHSATAP